MGVAERVRVQSVETLSDNWYILKKTTFDFLRSDGTWQRQTRETYDRGNGAAIPEVVASGRARFQALRVSISRVT